MSAGKMLGTACMLCLGAILGAPIGGTVSCAVIFWMLAK